MEPRGLQPVATGRKPPERRSGRNKPTGLPHSALVTRWRDRRGTELSVKNHIIVACHFSRGTRTTVPAVKVVGLRLSLCLGMALPGRLLGRGPSANIAP
jgi:hypothetical protein